jgi:pyruvate/2-oxoglutarate dehydrogenase complex dihydrolipoamide dehydrogenase (E3) component
MDPFDFVIIGAGAAGEAAAFKARSLGASVAVVERDLVGGGCAYWACIPSKTLLHAAAVHAAGGDYPWERASARRDYMINRARDAERPDDSSRFNALVRAGATAIRGEARLAGPGRVDVVGDDGPRSLGARNVVIATGSRSRVPTIEGLVDVRPWTNVQATSTRELPRSLLILGGGPTAVELAQVYARYGVPTTIVEHNDRINARDHPRNSAALAAGLKRDGVTIRTGVRAIRARAATVPGNAHVIELQGGETVTGHAVLLAIGRDFDLDRLGLETVGFDPTAKDGPNALPMDGRLRVAEGLFVVGDPAGPELHTHVSHYQGEMAVRMALGEDVKPDYRAIPRATYTDPEAASVGLTLDAARAAGIDAFEELADLATSAKGYVLETAGHVSIVVDRVRGELVGAAIAGPGASEAIHEAVLAIRARVPISVLADTIQAFPTTARVMGGLFVQAAGKLAESRAG